jgi:hypothetical protein
MPVRLEEDLRFGYSAVSDAKSARRAGERAEARSCDAARAGGHTAFTTPTLDPPFSLGSWGRFGTGVGGDFAAQSAARGVPVEERGARLSEPKATVSPAK